MLFNRYPVPDSLLGTVEAIWIYKNVAGLPADSLNMSVANGKAKLLMSMGNQLTARITGQPDQLIPANSLIIVGVTTQPVCLFGHGPLRLISVEFAVGMAYRFLNLPLVDLTNAIWPVEAVFGPSLRDLTARLNDESNLSLQVNLLIDYLVRLLLVSTRANPLINYAVKTIEQQRGLVNISELCRKVGYSHRHIDKQFLNHVGVTPKLLARIIRFQTTFRQLVNQPALPQADLYQIYYDQPHYIREFKHFAGYSPRVYAHQRNSFGELFYR